MLLHSNNIVGTIKDFVYYDVESKEKIPDFIVMKKPQFWVYHNTCTKDGKRTGSKEQQDCIIEQKVKSKNSFPISVLETKIQKNKCQLISAKTLQKCLRREELVFLAFVRPIQTQQEQGMTQRVKRE